MHHNDCLCCKTNNAVLLKKFAGGGGRVDVQKLFGFMGLFTLAALWWLSKACYIFQSPVTVYDILYLPKNKYMICYSSFA